MELGKSMAGLEQVLKPPKARGGLGEFLLESLLSQMLPRENFDLQYRFKDGTVVDAVVKFKDWLLPIDSKFPLENFERHLRAPEEGDRRRFFKDFMSDCVKHVEKIAKTYIKPDEGTLDLAFMYVPAENVYYHMLVPPEGFEGKPILETAWERRVIPVSPNTLYAYLQVILVGLKGMKVEEKAREVFELLTKMKRMFESFSEEHEKLGGHLERASKSYDASAAKLEKFGSSMGTGDLLPGPGGEPQSETDQVK
jgi:DNA recombination protein RmuC